MQKFLIVQSQVASMPLLHRAALDMMLDGKPQDVRHRYHALFSKCKILDDDTAFLAIHPAPGGIDLRKEIVPLLDSYSGSMADLDRANRDQQLRIVAVPDFIRCHVMVDEYGNEYVSELHQYFYPDDDPIYIAKRDIRQFCCSHSVAECRNITEPVSAGSVSIAFHGDYGLASTEDPKRGRLYMFLKKNTYYSALPDRPKELYELESSVGAMLAQTEAVYDQESLAARAELIAKFLGKDTDPE